GKTLISEPATLTIAPSGFELGTTFTAYWRVSPLSLRFVISRTNCAASSGGRLLTTGGKTLIAGTSLGCVLCSCGQLEVPDLSLQAGTSYTVSLRISIEKKSPMSLSEMVKLTFLIDSSSVSRTSVVE